MNTDPIADLLTRIRNALMVGKRDVEIPSSKEKLNILNVLMEEGYIERYELKEDNSRHSKTVKVILKYDKEGYPVIRKIKRVSSPGQRQFFAAQNLPRVINGAGICVVSTSKGVMTDRAARRMNVGGEVLCTVE